MTDKPVSRYLLRPLRGICQTCHERIARDDGVCEVCADVVGLDERRDIKKWGG